MIQGLPDNFFLANESNVKQPVLVAVFDGLNDVLTSADLFTRIRYGDPDIEYGGTDAKGNPWLYGGLRPYVTANGGTFKPYLSWQGSSLTISQKMEQEQGRCSISTMTLGFIDKDEYMSELITPGLKVPEILGLRVRIFLGYQNISYPEDFIQIFQGLVQDITSQPGLVILSLADPNIRRRAQAMYIPTTTLSGTINDTATTINVVSNGDFFERILGPDGSDDTGIHTYIQIDDEVIEYDRLAFQPNSFNESGGGIVTRGARGTTAVGHDDQSDVTSTISFSGNPITIALKLMLAGWNGPYQTGVPIQNILFSGIPAIGNIARAIILPIGVDAVFDLGLAVGDYITITGDTNLVNNQTVRVERFENLEERQNQVIITNSTTLVTSVNSTGTLALRSQYDTWPVSAALQLDPVDVDVAGHQFYRDSFLAQEAMNFYQTSPIDSVKEFIEKECLLPISCFALTKAGQISMKLTLPPLAGQKLTSIDKDSIIDPKSMYVNRSTSNRKFFNEITFSFDPDDAGNFTQVLRFLDTDSLAPSSDGGVGLSSILPISSMGTRETGTLAERAERMLDRYKRGAVQLMLKVNFGKGNNIDPGDILLLTDDGALKITNMATGNRNLGKALMEVQERAFDFKSGNTSLTLLSGLNFTLQDIFATWAPSSNVVAAGTTSSQVRIQPSYGAVMGTDEFLKWVDYIGCRLQFHDYFYTYSGEAVLVAADNNVLTIEPPLSFTPDANTIVDLAPYSTSTDPTVDEAAKIIHVHWDKTATVVSGASQTQFDVGAGDVQFFRIGYPIRVHAPDWSTDSSEVLITNVLGTTITTEDLGYTPSAGDDCELLSFYDARGPYRFV